MDARRGIARLVPCALALSLLLGPWSAAGSPARNGALTLGSVTLHRCVDVVKAWCGSVPEPLDPFMAGGPTITVGFVWFPASGTPVGTLVADEGGPGWPASGSASEYRAMYGPLLETRNLLLVDNRGTGRSSAIDCPALQHYFGSTVGWGFQRLVGECGRALNHTWRDPAGRFIHASDLFSTPYAVKDMADIVKRLGVAPIDLYGDSYGTWFVQSFLSRHPELLRSVVLDSAYPMFGGSPWYPSSARTAKVALRRVCERDLACTAAAPTGSPRGRLAQLLDVVRRIPIVGATTNPDGHTVMESVLPRSLANMIQNAGFDPVDYREFDPAVRAALGGDDAPILRLSARADYYDDATPVDPHDYSDGLYFAVSCAEYTQLFDMDAPVATRRQQLATAEQQEPAATQWFAPFTAAEWAQTNAYSEAYTACLDWPSWHRPYHIQTQGHKPPLAPPGLPVLVMNGDLDSWTSATFGTALLEQLGPSARFVELPNSVHTSPLGDTPSAASTACGDAVIRAFIRAPQDLFDLRFPCVANIPPVHTVGSFPATLAAAAAADVVTGSATPTQSRAVTVAAGAFGDAMMSFYLDDGSRGAGLRGGRFVGKGWPVVRLKLKGVRWVGDALVAGRGTWDINGGDVSASLTVKSGGIRTTVTLTWNENRPWATATIPATGAVLRFAAP